MPIFIITVAKKHQNSVTLTSFHVDQVEHGLSCLLTMELLAYVFASSANPCTRFSVRNSLKYSLGVLSTVRFIFGPVLVAVKPRLLGPTSQTPTLPP
jgi:hypothetical protein